MFSRLSRLMTWGACAALLLGLACGCGKGGKPTKVSGVLTWDDGTPIDSATVVFMPTEAGKKQASGFTGKDGTFELTTTSPNDGAYPGEYKVVVTRADDSDIGVLPGGQGQDVTKAMQEYAKKKETMPKTKSVIPTAYTAEKTTPLHATVPSDDKIKLSVKKA